MPATTSNWQDFNAEEASKMMKFAQEFKVTSANDNNPNEIIDDKVVTKDGSTKKLLLEAMQRSAKKSANFNEHQLQTSAANDFAADDSTPIADDDNLGKKCLDVRSTHRRQRRHFCVIVALILCTKADTTYDS